MRFNFTKYLLIITTIFMVLVFPEIAQGQINITTSNSNSGSSLDASFRAVDTKRIGNILYAPIILDGQEIFYVASPFSAQADKTGFTYFSLATNDYCLYCSLGNGFNYWFTFVS
jgi:hypothetical protein